MNGRGLGELFGGVLGEEDLTVAVGIRPNDADEITRLGRGRDCYLVTGSDISSGIAVGNHGSTTGFINNAHVDIGVVEGVTTLVVHQDFVGRRAFLKCETRTRSIRVPGLNAENDETDDARENDRDRDEQCNAEDRRHRALVREQVLYRFSVHVWVVGWFPRTAERRPATSCTPPGVVTPAHPSACEAP